MKDLAGLSQATQNENKLRLDALALEVQSLLARKRWRNANNEEFSKLANQLRLFTEEAATGKKIVRILKSLHFGQVKERESDIMDAHGESLGWVFDPSSDVNFVRWLSSSDVSKGIYWITGKAGSGKFDVDEVH